MITINKHEKEVEERLLDNEKAMLKQLERTYINALGDVKARVRLLMAREQTQSVIYQIGYQNSLEKQINSILEILQQDNVTNVTDFLNTMYEDGYIGLQYELAKQGVPVITAINQEEVAKTLLQKTAEMTFAERLGVNMVDFKTKIKDEISRGIASGSTYTDIAQQLSLVTGESLNKSYRIARTEGHRITTEAKLTSMERAKNQGADVVKQWDATLDGKTRKSHRKLDGQWVETDGYFEINGRKTKGPGKFGRAEEDINCRCILLTRPRWAVDKRRVKSAKVEDEYGKEVRRLIEVDNYEAYKKGYYKLLDKDPKVEEIVRKANERVNRYREAGGYDKWIKTGSNIEKVLKDYTQGHYRNIGDYSQYMRTGKSLNTKILESVTEDDKANAKIIMDIIANQKVTDKPLYRLETNYFDIEPKVGEVMDFGIRSTSRNPNIATDVFLGKDEGLTLASHKNYIEYRFETSKALDISHLSTFTNQEEELISGKYKVTKVEDVVASDIKDTLLPFKEYKEKHKERFEEFTSKKGNEMVRDLTNNKIYSKSQVEYGYFTNEGDYLSGNDVYEKQRELEENTFKRKIVYLKYEED